MPVALPDRSIFGHAPTLLNRIAISTFRITTEVEVILEGPPLRKAEAQLLGAGGAELQRFALANGSNHLFLESHPPGKYTLRINTDNEVLAREITIHDQLFSTT